MASSSLLTIIETALELYLTPVPGTPTAVQQGIWQALRYAVLGGGKRIRPVLLLQTGLACGGALPHLLPAACALELLHAYSLVHDDLPAMDNDDLRRGQPTVHRAFDEATAILAGDALQGLAFGLLSGQLTLPDDFWTTLRSDNSEPFKPPALSAELQLAVLREFSAVASMEGLVNGQYADMHFGQMAASAPDPSLAHLQHSFPHDDIEEVLTYIHKNKTAALFKFSTRAGARLAGMPESLVNACGILGEGIGLGFQVVDDLLDIHSTPELLGKTPGKDQAQGKLTFPAVYGEEGTRTYWKQLEEQLLTQVDLLQTLLHEEFNRPQTCCEPIRDLVNSIGQRLH